MKRILVRQLPLQEGGAVRISMQKGADILDIVDISGVAHVLFVADQEVEYEDRFFRTIMTGLEAPDLRCYNYVGTVNRTIGASWHVFLSMRNT